MCACECILSTQEWRTGMNLITGEFLLAFLQRDRSQETRGATDQVSALYTRDPVAVCALRGVAGMRTIHTNLLATNKRRARDSSVHSLSLFLPTSHLQHKGRHVARADFVAPSDLTGIPYRTQVYQVYQVDQHGRHTVLSATRMHSSNQVSDRPPNRY